MASGVYYIKNLVDGKIYVGQTNNLKGRLSRHICKLKHNNHENSYLQHAINKYGVGNFEILAIEEVANDLLDEREIYWINFYESTNRSKGYNIEGGGNKNKVITEEMRLNKTGLKNPMFGRNHSEKTLEDMSISTRGTNNKVNEQEVFLMKQMLSEGVSQLDVANKFNIKRSTVNKIQKGINWGYVNSELNNHLFNMHEKNKINKINKVKKMYEDGKTINEILKETKHDSRFISRALGTTTTELMNKRNKEIVQDFKKGIDKADTQKKYNISSSVYNDAVKEVRSESIESLRNLAVEMRKQGFAVNKIATMLKKHRTTITEWTT